MSADFRLGRWEDVLQDVECDALIVDAPYSERTHAGHNGGSARANVASRNQRRAIHYPHWTEADVATFVEHWSERTRGWFVTLTDHTLARAWEAELQLQGRYVFAPLACIEPGSRVRLIGDGPAQWAHWIVVARPRSAAFARWGSLPGGYVTPTGFHERKSGAAVHVMGGKPLWLMRALVRDYSRPGDLICDPCAGGATTLVAARCEGRRGVGAEMDETHYRLGRMRLSRGYTPPLFADRERTPMEQLALGGAE